MDFCYWGWLVEFPGGMGGSFGGEIGDGTWLQIVRLRMRSQLLEAFRLEWGII